MNELKEYIVLFLVGGFTLVGIKYTSKYVSPIMAAIIGALPIGLFSTYFLINHAKTSGYLKNYIKQTTLTLGLASLYFYGIETFDHTTIYALTIMLWILFSYMRLVKHSITKKFFN